MKGRRPLRSRDSHETRTARRSLVVIALALIAIVVLLVVVLGQLSDLVEAIEGVGLTLAVVDVAIPGAPSG